MLAHGGCNVQADVALWCWKHCLSLVSYQRGSSCKRASAEAMHTTTQNTLSQRPLGQAAAGCRQRIRAVKCRCETATGQKKVVVLGGTGRVGSATAASLLENFKQYDITVASRSQSSFDKIMEIRPGLKGARFAPCDITDKESVKVCVVWSIQA